MTDPYAEWCHIHNVSETWDDDCFRECPECGHVYRTVGEFIRATLERWGEVIGVAEAERRTSCALCTHDW